MGCCGSSPSTGGKQQSEAPVKYNEKREEDVIRPPSPQAEKQKETNEKKEEEEKQEKEKEPAASQSPKKEEKKVTPRATSQENNLLTPDRAYKNSNSERKLTKENSYDSAMTSPSQSPSPPHYAHASPITNSSFNNGSFNNMLHASPSVYGLPMNMSLTLVRSPPEGSASQAPPDANTIVRSVRKCATMQPQHPNGDSSGTPLGRGQSLTFYKVDSSASLRRDESLPFFQGVPLAHSESNLATFVKEREEEADKSPEQKEKEKEKEPVSPANPLALSGLIRSPIEATRVETPDDEPLDNQHLTPTPARPKKQMSFMMDFLANTHGGGQYGIKVSCCDPEPTKNKELDILQGTWEDSAENAWKVEERTASVVLKESGDKESYQLEDAPQQSPGSTMLTLGRITLMGALVARHEWSQIVWSDGDVWQQVWKEGQDVDVYYGDDEGWYGGKVKQRKEDGRYDIIFDDGEVTENVVGGHMRAREKDLFETFHLLPPINPHL